MFPSENKVIERGIRVEERVKGARGFLEDGVAATYICFLQKTKTPNAPNN
jgi:hypothetical protein